MADVNANSDALIQTFIYSKTNNGALDTLADPLFVSGTPSIGVYVYDQTNALVYSDLKTQRDPNYPAGVFDTYVPPTIFKTATQPETYYTVQTVVILPDGRTQSNTKQISVD